ncbi:MAG: mechanosensitive ion channel family protein [Candidatus Goldbacteria bacterium]|nr:mechanosensitive ion channel family protein [Candidatus Goldiibacteriota bacterium]
MDEIKKLFSADTTDNVWIKLSIFAFIIILGFIIIFLLKKLYKTMIKKEEEKKSYLFQFLDTAIDKTIIPILFFGVFYIAFNYLNLSEKVNRYIQIFFIIGATFFGLKFFVNLISFFIELYFINKESDATKIKNLKGVLVVLKVLIWGLGFILILDNLGYKVSTVLAGLGIGGIAVALAAQTIFKDLFSYFIIIFDKPFEVGDFIIVGDLMGTVETIGLKTTRIRSISGEEMIFSNSDLTDSRVKNFKRMYNRRVVFSIGVTYDTPLEKLKQIPGIIKNIIESIKDTKFDRAHFFKYGDFALIYEVVYFVMSSDYNRYMDIQQEINFKIKEEFDRLKIEFAYPTQTVYLNNVR